MNFFKHFQRKIFSTYLKKLRYIFCCFTYCHLMNIKALYFEIKIWEKKKNSRLENAISLPKKWRFENFWTHFGVYTKKQSPEFMIPAFHDYLLVPKFTRCGYLLYISSIITFFLFDDSKKIMILTDNTVSHLHWRITHCYDK